MYKQTVQIYKLDKKPLQLLAGIIFQMLEKKSPDVLLLFLDTVAKEYSVEDSKPLPQNALVAQNSDIVNQIVRIKCKLLLLQQSNNGKNLLQIQTLISNHAQAFEQQQYLIEVLADVYKKSSNELKDAALLQLVNSYNKLFRENLDINRFVMAFDSYRAYVKLLVDLAEGSAPVNLLELLLGTEQAFFHASELPAVKSELIKSLFYSLE